MSGEAGSLARGSSLIRVGILGSGFMGRTHAMNLSRIEGVSVRALCARDTAAARETSAVCTGGVAAVFESFTEMLDAVPLDALFVCIPPHAHEGQVEEAARRGIHVFLEKPIALTRARGRSMTAAVEKAGVVSQVGYHCRFGTAVELLKAMIESGGAGRPTLLQGRYYCNSLHADWWRDRERGGGQVLEQAIHLYDLAAHFLGVPATASGQMANLCHADVPDYTVEDTSVSAVRFASGALAGIAGSNCAVPMAWEMAFTVVCGRVTAFFTSPNNAVFVKTGGTEPQSERVDAETDLYVREARDFFSAIRGNGRTRCPIREGLVSLELVLAVTESARAGGAPVAITPLL
jgi:predicted dehydrogenase